MNPLSEVTYKLEVGPPSIFWRPYAERALSEFKRLLSGDPREAEVQRFLECNPSFVPGAWTPGGGSGHWPLHMALIARPALPGLSSRKPDFMWIAAHSGCWYPTLIEIERPGKRVFKRAGVPTAEFTQARNQLAQWRTWFNSPSNVQQFIDSYGIPQLLREQRNMQLHMILVYGRRSEFENDPELSRQRASLLPGADEELMSFDRLSPDEKLRHAIAVRAAGSGRFTVLDIPPVFAMGPTLATRLLYISGFAEAIDRSKEISAERKEFLKERVTYWRDWARSRGLGFTIIDSSVE